VEVEEVEGAEVEVGEAEEVEDRVAVGEEAAGEDQVAEAAASSSTWSRPRGGGPFRRGCSSAGLPILRPCSRSTHLAQ
jgi:hypothetical protein